MFNILKLVKNKYMVLFNKKEFEDKNDYFMQSDNNEVSKLSIEENFDPDKPNRLLKFALGRDYHSYPDYVSSELTKSSI